MEYYAENKFKTEDDELLEKEVMKIKEHTNYSDLKIELTSYVYKEIKQNFMGIVNQIEQKYDVNIDIVEDEKINKKNTKIILK